MEGPWIIRGWDHPLYVEGVHIRWRAYIYQQF